MRSRYLVIAAFYMQQRGLRVLDILSRSPGPFVYPQHHKKGTLYFMKHRILALLLTAVMLIGFVVPVSAQDIINITDYDEGST